MILSNLAACFQLPEVTLSSRRELGKGTQNRCYISGKYKTKSRLPITECSRGEGNVTRG